MHECISVKDDEMTRVVKLKNIDTGTVEECFDDSKLVSETSFDFMEIGKQYECKIKLFGKVIEENSRSVLCTVIDRNIVIGSRNMVKIKVENNIYYIPEKKLVGYADKDTFMFHYTRKDLIQVDDVIHGDML